MKLYHFAKSLYRDHHLNSRLQNMFFFCGDGHIDKNSLKLRVFSCVVPAQKNDVRDVTLDQVNNLTQLNLWRFSAHLTHRLILRAATGCFFGGTHGGEPTCEFDRLGLPDPPKVRGCSDR